MIWDITYGRLDFDFHRRRREVLAGIDESIALEAVLLVVQLAVPALPLDQLGMRAALDDLAGLDDEDLVRALDRGQPVRDHEGGPAAAQRAQAVLNQRFALAVEA